MTPRPTDELYNTMSAEHYTNSDGVTGLPPPQSSAGTILEAAFVDPAYSYPPAEGQGKHAIELQATPALLQKLDGNESDDISSTDLSASPSFMSTGTSVPSVSMAEREAEENLRKQQKTKVKTTKEVYETYRGWGFFKCCKSTEAVVKDQEFEDVGPTEEEIAEAKAEAASYARQKKQDKQKKREARDIKKHMRLQAREEKRKRRIQRNKEEFEKMKFNRVAEGILIYRLDTSSRTITLLSPPNSNTDVENLLHQMVVASATPSNDKTRRGICLVGVDGTRATLTACEQRTAVSWLEAIDMMLGHSDVNSFLQEKETSWSREDLDTEQRAVIEEQYLNLAAYSNNLIRAGGIPGDKKERVGGIYYSVTTKKEEGDQISDETLESIAKRRAVIKDSWDFYRMICSLLRDRRKYDEVFRKMQLDPVYPYLNSMTGLNDPGDNGYENVEKRVMQKRMPHHDGLSKMKICEELVTQAEDALSSLVEICKALAGSLGMEEVGVGPIKEASAAIRKAEKKYAGDIYKVTDYCRALLVVKDFSTLLAVLELARDSFGPLIRRVKLTSLKSDHQAIPGGYRDCKINLELKDHVCEIQIHLWPMWVVCGVDGFRHYRHCLEYSTDSFEDSYDALEGLDRKTMAEMIVMAEEAVADMPLDLLEWYHEKFILDYFAEIGLFIRHGLYVWAEVTLRYLIKLRSESPDIGPEHHETVLLQKYLEQALRLQGNVKEADETKEKVNNAAKRFKKEKEAAGKSLWDSFIADPMEALDMIMDPNKKEREEEERRKKEVKASKRAWRKIRERRFKFLDEGMNDSPKHE